MSITLNTALKLLPSDISIAVALLPGYRLMDGWLELIKKTWNAREQLKWASLQQQRWIPLDWRLCP